jgi:hypothetical protein
MLRVKEAAMPRPFPELLTDALALETSQRARLAEKLLESLDELPSEEIQRLWGEEAQRRLEALRAGKGREVDGPEALRRALNAIS